MDDLHSYWNYIKCYEKGEKRKRDEALQQIIDAQVALNEEKEVDENQQKMEEMKYSIKEELSKDEGDSLYNGQNPMNSLRNKE